MDYEKKYKEALEMAEETIRYYKEHNRSNEASIEDLEQIFPELKESEDEKIRKALVRFHKSTIDIDGIKGADILAWLEKQGQTFTKKDVDDAYLKGIFDTKQGKQDARYLYLEEIIAADDIYQMSMNDAMVNEAKEKAAKALSKLGIGKLLGFEKQGEQKPTSNTRYKVSAGGSLIVVDGKPFDYEHATITQKDFAPKQEPKKTEDEIEIPFGAKDSELQEETYYIPKGFHAEIEDDKVVIKKGEKSAAWSDEDEENLQHCCMAISADGLHTYEDKQEMEAWLKSLKDRIGK